MNLSRSPRISTVLTVLTFFFVCFVSRDTRADTATISDGIEKTETTLRSDPSGILDIRIRPFALVSQTPGAEFDFILNRRLELGPTVHYFSRSNDIRGSSVNTWEFGFKASYLVWERSFREGVYLSAAFYEFLSQVIQDQVIDFDQNDNPVIVQPYAATGHFLTRGLTITAAYQWNLNLFHSDTWTLRLGAGYGYKEEHVQNEIGSDGSTVPLGVIERKQPVLDFTLGAAI